MTKPLIMVILKIMSQITLYIVGFANLKIHKQVLILMQSIIVNLKKVYHAKNKHQFMV